MTTTRPIIIRRSAAIGDALACTIVANALFARGEKVIFQSFPACWPVLKRVRSIQRVEMPLSTPDIDLDGCYENRADRTRHHLFDMIWDAFPVEWDKVGGIRYFKQGPTMQFSPEEQAMAVGRLSNHPRPWVFISPRSEHYSTRQVPDGVCQAAAEKIDGTPFWTGLHPAPKGIVDLHIRDLDFLMVMMTAADLFITVDTGPMHIAAALGLKILAIHQSVDPALRLPSGYNFGTIAPDLNCLNCQKNVCPLGEIPPCQNIDPDQISATANQMLRHHPMSLCEPSAK